MSSLTIFTTISVFSV